MTQKLSDRIDRTIANELETWARKLDATPQQVEEAVDAVGDQAADVEMHLKGARSTSNAERMADAGGTNEAPAYSKQTPAEKSMKREARTPAENDDLAGRNNEAAVTGERKPPPTKGDAAVGETDNQGSSPYGLRGRPEKAQRDE